MRRRLFITVCAVLVVGCGGTARVEIPQPQDLPFEVTWVNLNPDIEDVFFLDQTTGWAVGGGGSVLATEDGGTSWQPRAHLQHDLDEVFFVDRSSGWVASGEGEVLSSSDGGRSWTLRVDSDQHGACQLQFFGPKEGRVVIGRSLLATEDGGETWTSNLLPEFFYCRDAHFSDPDHGWAVAGSYEIVATRDGGSTWIRQERGGPQAVFSVSFLDENAGWAGVYGGVLRTADGGRSWLPPPSRTRFAFDKLQFVDPLRGWALAYDGGILQSNDGGRTWTESTLPEPSDRPQLKALFFVDASRGWAGGYRGTLLATDDGGASWRRQNEVLPLEHFVGEGSRIVSGLPFDAEGDTGVSIPQARYDKRYRVQEFLFANTATGWAIGSFLASAFEDDPVGALFSTTDGGRNWSVDHLPFEPSSLHYVPGGTVLIYANDFFTTQEVLYRGAVARHAPSLRSFAFAETGAGEIELRWQARGREAVPAETVRLEFSQADARGFAPIVLTGLDRGDDGVFSLTLDAAEYGIGDGAQLSYRVTLEDDGLGYTHVVPATFVFRPWWKRQHPGTKSMVAGGLLAAGYYSLSFLLLLVLPRASIRIQQWFPIDRMVTLVPLAAVQAVVQRVLQSVGPHYFSTHRRARRAWLARFRADYGVLSGLPAGIGEDFLRHDEVCAAWVEHYRGGRCRFMELPPEVRTDYLQKPACLDAWIERRVGPASEAFHRLDPVRQRSICIPLPGRIGDLATGSYYDSPDSRELRTLFNVPTAVLAILGEGGTGKSTLAFQLAHWALSDDPQKRLTPHRMLPVLVEEETADLAATVRGILVQMVGPDEVTAEIVECLLAHKRLLVVFDGFSERSAETQRHVGAVHRQFRVGALIVTSRREPEFGAVDVAEVRPEKVTPATMFYFVAEYLRRTGSAELFPGRTALELGERLLSVIETSSREAQIAPLFVTVFIDQAVELRRCDSPLEQLPVSLAETIIEHLRRTNPRSSDVPNRVETDHLIEVTRVLGRCSLTPDFVPREVFREDAEQTLLEHGIELTGADPILRLIDNGILVERNRGGTRMLRFALDPIAEYMAALYWLDRLRDRRQDWERWAAGLVSEERRPESMVGFLSALENCVTAYREDFDLPDLPASLRLSIEQSPPVARRRRGPTARRAPASPPAGPPPPAGCCRG